MASRDAASADKIANRSDTRRWDFFQIPPQDRSDPRRNLSTVSDAIDDHSRCLSCIPSSLRVASSFPSSPPSSCPSSVPQLPPYFPVPPSQIPVSLAVPLPCSTSPVTSLSTSSTALCVPGDVDCKPPFPIPFNRFLNTGLHSQSKAEATQRPGEHEDEFFPISGASQKAPEVSKKLREALAETAPISAGLGDSVRGTPTHKTDRFWETVGVQPTVTLEERRNETTGTDREERGVSGTLENAASAMHARCNKRQREDKNESEDASGTENRIIASGQPWVNKTTRVREGQRDERQDTWDACGEDNQESVSVSSGSEENTKKRQKASLPVAADSSSSFSASSLPSSGVPGHSPRHLILNEEVAEKQERRVKPEAKDEGKGGKETEGREEEEETLFEFDEDDLWFLLYERQRQESARNNGMAMDSPESDTLPEERQLSEELKGVVTDSLAKQILYSDKYQDSAYEYRAVTLPLQHPFLLRNFSPFAESVRRERRRMSDKLWRSLGIRMSCGWRHSGWSMYEPNVLFFARPKSTDGITGIPPKSVAAAAKRHDRMRDLLAQEVAKGMKAVSRAVRLARMATQDCHLMTDTEDDESSFPICGLYQDCMR